MKTKEAKYCDLDHEHYQHCYGKRPCDCGMCEDKPTHTNKKRNNVLTITYLTDKEGAN